MRPMVSQELPPSWSRHCNPSSVPTGCNICGIAMPEVGKKKHYDVFISYRHKRGDGYARSIRDALDARGLRAYLDVDDWKKPVFDVELLERIAEAPNFVAVLTPNSLDDCHDPEDWLRREIACAV